MKMCYGFKYIELSVTTVYILTPLPPSIIKFSATAIFYNICSFLEL